MLNSTHTTEASKIVKVLNGGVEFYQHGIENVVQPSVRAMFQRMVDEKQKGIAMMRPYIVSDSADTRTSKDWYAEFEKRYSPLLNEVKEQPDVVYIAHLEDVEEQVMEVIEATLNNIEHSGFATELRCIRTRMQQCRDEMHSLKEAIQ